MKTCEKCGLEKREDEFRRKDTGPRAGFVFPRCITCEQDDHADNLAAELRALGFTVTRDPQAPGAR